MCLCVCLCVYVCVCVCVCVTECVPVCVTVSVTDCVKVSARSVRLFLLSYKLQEINELEFCTCQL